MNYVKEQFVALPRLLDLNKLRIKHTDTLIYISIRSYQHYSGDCFPSYETIANRAKCSRSFVIGAIKRLEKANLITVKRSKKRDYSNRYSFSDFEMFERIPYQIFFENLTLEEKSILLLTRQFLNRSGIGSTHLNIKEIAKQLGLSYKQLYNPWRKLMHKGYIEKCTGKTISKYKFTDKIDWNWYAALKALTVEQATPSKLLVG